MNIFASWIIFSIAIYLTAYLLPGVSIEDFTTALIAAIGLGFINTVLKPILIILTLPINILTFGLLTFVINAALVMLASDIVPGFSVGNFWWALLFSLVVSVINGLLEGITGKKK